MREGLCGIGHITTRPGAALRRLIPRIHKFVLLGMVYRRVPGLQLATMQGQKRCQHAHFEKYFGLRRSARRQRLYKGVGQGRAWQVHDEAEIGEAVELM